jgi:very-short-patch-repair endonuclease
VLWELEGFSAAEVEISTSGDRKPAASWILLHRIASLPRSEIGKVGPIPVTSPTGTVIDLCGVVDEDRAEAVLEDALRRNLTSLSRLRWAAGRRAGPGRRGSAVLRRLLDERGRGYTPAASVLESRLARLIDQAGIPRPTRQYEIRDGGRLVARVDFAYPDTHIAIEADGYRFHSGRLAWQHDRARRNVLTSRGWRVLHVTWEDLRSRPGELLDEIRRALETAP